MQVSHLSEPDMASTLPSGNTVPVGYQRGCFMESTRVHCLVAGSKISASGSPTPKLACPPKANTLPSARTTAALQNMFVRLLGMGVNTFVFGSQSRAE